MFSGGIHLYGMAPTLPKLQEDGYYSIPPLTDDQIQLIPMAFTIGSLPGVSLGSLLSDHFGRKFTVFFALVPCLISHGLLYFAIHVYMIYFAQFLRCVSFEMSLVTISTYVSEISSPNVRGTLNVFVMMAIVFGSLFIYVVAPILTIDITVLICFILTIGEILLLFFVIESPYFYIMKNKIINARKSLEILRQTKNIDDEVTKLENAWIIEQKNQASVFDILLKHQYRKPFLICLMLFGICQLSGLPILTSYCPTLLEQVKNPPITPYLGGILITISSIISVLFSGLLIDYLGRKPLMIISSAGCCLATGILGIYYYLVYIDYSNLHQLSMIPTLGLILLQVLHSIGLHSLPCVMTSELMATNVKTKSIALLLVCASVMSIGILVFYSMFPIYVTFWFFSSCSIVGILFGIFLIPETKNQSLIEIQNQFSEQKS